MARFTKNVIWTQKPPPGYQARNGLLIPDRLAVVFNEGDTGVVYNYASRVGSQNSGAPPSATYTVSNTTPASGRNGQRLGFSSTSAVIDWGDSSLFTPTAAVTIICGYQKRDATLRSATAFGINSSGAISRLSCDLPFSDGNVNWDWQSTTIGSGRTQLSGATFGDDIWAFTAGPRGTEIWQNGILKATTGFTGSRGSVNNTYVLGNGASGDATDLANWDFFYMWGTQIPQAWIQQITERPMRIFDGPYRTKVWAGFPQGAQNISVPKAALTTTTFAPAITISIPVPATSLAFTTFAPVVGNVIQVPAGALAITSYAPALTISIPVPAGTLGLTTYPPFDGIINTVVPKQTAAITTYAPSVVGSTTIPVPLGSLTISSYAPSVFVGSIGPCDDRFGPKIYFWEPSYLDRPEDTFLRATDWDSAGYPGMKFVQGLIIEADTEGQTREILLQGDQTDIETITINHNGQVEKPYSLNQPVLKHLLRLLPTDNAFWRLFNVRWVYEPAPEYAREWKTQGTDHDLPGFQFLKDGYIAHASTADITLNITVDDTTFTYIIPNSGGAYVKHYLIFGIHPSGRTTKGTLFTYELTSTQPFQLYQKDCEVRVHDWSGGEYVVKQPFGDISRVFGARI